MNDETPDKSRRDKPGFQENWFRRRGKPMNHSRRKQTKKTADNGFRDDKQI